MKRKSILVLAVLTVVIPITSSAQAQSGDSNANTSSGIPDSAQDDKAATDVLTVPAAAPSGAKELLQDYEVHEMAR
jgi:hypothetical protein